MDKILVSISSKPLRYLLTVLLAAIVDLCAFLLLLQTGVSVPLTAVLSFLVAAVINYQASSRYVFGQRPTFARFLVFLATGATGLLINSSTTWLAYMQGVSPLLAKLLGIGVAFVFNTWMNVTLVFRQHQVHQSTRDSPNLAAISNKLPVVATHWLFPIGVLFLVLPFMVVFTFPSQDGPAHLDTARLLVLLKNNAPLVSSVYTQADSGASNEIAPWILSGFVSYLDPTTAEWAFSLLLTLLITAGIALPLYLFDVPKVWGLVGLPLAFPHMLYMGSISLCLSYGFVFGALTLAGAYLRRPRSILLALFSALSILAFFVQAQSAIALLSTTVGGAAGVIIWRLLHGKLSEAARPLLQIVTASLPILILLVIYQAAFPRDVVHQGAYWSLRTLYAIIARREIAQFSIVDRALHMAMFGCLLALAVLWLRERWSAPAGDLCSEWLFAGALASSTVLLVLPYGTNAIPLIPQRLLPVAHFMLYLWLLCNLPQGRWRAVVLPLAIIIIGTTGVTRLLAHVRMSELIASRTRLEESIPDGSVVLPFNIGRIVNGGGIVGSPPLGKQGGLHLAFLPWYHHGRGFGLKDVINIGNYQALPMYPYFRVSYKPPSPTASEPDMAAVAHPSRAALLAWITQFEVTVRRRVTHVILSTEGLDVEQAALESPGAKAVLQLLQQEFEPLPSTNGASATLWVRR